MATLLNVNNESKTHKLRVSSAIELGPDDEFVDLKIEREFLPGEFGDVLLTAGRGLFFEEVSNDN
jgi:hypothetical protein